jgi:hypothetical protein
MSQSEKYSATDSRNPLHQPVLLLQVLNYVGPGHRLLLSTVNSLWHELYNSVRSTVIVNIRKDNGHLLRCTSKMTLFSSVCTSPSTLRFAHEAGLDVSGALFQLTASQYTAIETLKVLHELDDTSCSNICMHGAPRAGFMLQLVVVSNCCAGSSSKAWNSRAVQPQKLALLLSSTTSCLLCASSVLKASRKMQTCVPLQPVQGT